MRPKRENLQGNQSSYFVSTQTVGRKPFFRHERWTRLILATLKHYDGPGYTLHAYVIMPDHLHLLITPMETVEKVRAQMKADGANAEVELYPGTHHGFAFPKRPVYDRAAAERHWERLLALYRRNLV